MALRASAETERAGKRPAARRAPTALRPRGRCGSAASAGFPSTWRRDARRSARLGRALPRRLPAPRPFAGCVPAGSGSWSVWHGRVLVRLRKRLIQRDAVRAFRVGDAPGKDCALHALRACVGDGDGVFVPLHVGHQKRRTLAQPQHAHDVRRVRARDDDAVVFYAVSGDKEQGCRRHLQYPSAFTIIILFSASRVKRLHNIRTVFPYKMSRLDASARRRV